MGLTIGITLGTIAILIWIILANPVLKFGRYHVRLIYWFAPVLGAILLFLCGKISFPEALAGLTSAGSMNPIKILILFISMTTLSIFLDEAGMFSYLASRAMALAGSSQKKLFLCLYLVVSVLTVFTSNDIIILTFTPFICYFSKNAQIDPMPYLFGEFVAANTWSMALIIGNPTNIYLATSAGISFGDYTATMIIPTVISGTVAFAILFLIFRRKLSKPMSGSAVAEKIKNKGFIIIGVIHLAACTILLVLSSYIGFEMWYITLGFAVSLFACVLIYQKVKRNREHLLLHTIVRAPWELIPFVISMFLIVLALNKSGVTMLIADVLGNDFAIWKYGASSFVCANLINNIPMSVLFSDIAGVKEGILRMQALYASVIGSNLGAYFTPIGALAGIMWSGILGKMGISFSFKKYVSLGVRVAIPALAAALLGLMLVML